MNKTTARESHRQNKERSIWDRLAPGYDRQVMAVYRDAYDLSIEKVRELVSPESRILEIGCGTGIISLALASEVREIAAVDISPKMIEKAVEKAHELNISNVDFRAADGYELPFEDSSFDAILLFNILHIVKDPPRLLHEASRLLRDEGYLFTATDCNAEPAPLKARCKIHLQLLLKTLGIIPFMWNYRMKDLHHLLEENSFYIEKGEVFHSAPVNYYLRGRKTGSPF